MSHSLRWILSSTLLLAPALQSCSFIDIDHQYTACATNTDCVSGRVCQGGLCRGKSTDGFCLPTSCTAAGATCGAVDDLCGDQLFCGSCDAPATCGGGGVPNTCGCTPTTPAEDCVDDVCGDLPDGCGGTVSCGDSMCSGVNKCGGGGVANRCGCTPESDSALCLASGLNCGSPSLTDNCGQARTPDCGLCGQGQTCGGDPSLPNVCDQTDAQLCEQAGDNCGTPALTDVLGNVRSPDCGGTCEQGLTCGGNGTDLNVCDQTDEQLCEQAGDSCGSPTLEDALGVMRLVACGTCVTGQTCGGNQALPNVCDQTDAQLCAQAGDNCGAPTLTDATGSMRQPICGTCPMGQTCGGSGAPSQVNVCDQTDAQLCAQAGDNCGTPTVMDALGVLRMPSCGATCPTGSTCGGNGIQPNVCDQTNAQLCLQADASCGSVTLADALGVSRTVSCGTCPAGQTCGGNGTQANVCDQTDQQLCQQAGDNCGTPTLTDSTGSMRQPNCGDCPMGQTCGGNGVSSQAYVCDQTDAQLCAQAGDNCGAPTVMDALGVLRMPSCGATCPAGSTCGGNGIQPNVCDQTNAQLCLQAGANCGSVTLADALGVSRTVACGTCPAGETCGGNGAQLNVCDQTDQQLCLQAGDDCGTPTLTDHVGTARMVLCGSCDAGTTCGGSGLPSQQYLCDQTDAQLCQQAGDDCGTPALTDLLGNPRLPSCGNSCTPGLTCGGNGEQLYVCDQTNAQLCAQAGDDCGSPTLTDAVGVMRVVNCGTCPASQTCGGNHTLMYVCDQTDLQLCSQNGDDCGAPTFVDALGATRQPSCGTCPSGQTCGGSGSQTEQYVCDQTDAQLCQQAGDNCSVPTLTDVLGVSRTPNCGTSCPVGQTCGGNGVQQYLCDQTNAQLCAQAGDNCGTPTLTDAVGASRVVSCGDMCPTGQTCGGNPSFTYVCDVSDATICAGTANSCGVLPASPDTVLGGERTPNCGTCPETGATCGANEIANVCGCGADAGTLCVNANACVDTVTNQDNCGKCGNQCGSWTYCAHSACVTPACHGPSSWGSGNVGTAGGNVDCPAGGICNDADDFCATPSYTNTANTVKDAVTGLVWQRTLSSGTPSYNLGSAESFCAALSLDSYTSGWRVPTVPELFSLVNTATTPTIDPTQFPNSPSDLYWTTTEAYSDSLGTFNYLINFSTGGGYYDFTTHSHFVRCVY